MVSASSQNLFDESEPETFYEDVNTGAYAINRKTSAYDFNLLWTLFWDLPVSHVDQKIKP